MLLHDSGRGSYFVAASLNLRTGTRAWKTPTTWRLVYTMFRFFFKPPFLNAVNISTFFAFESSPTRGCTSRSKSISLSGPKRDETKEP